MSTPKALREARAALAAIEAKRKELVAAIAEAGKDRVPIEAKVAAIAKRRRRVQVIKFLAGAYYVGTLADLTAEIRYAFKDGAKPTPKAIRDGLESGTIKIGAGGYGQSYSLKGLLPRIRLLDKPTFRTYQRKVAARKRAEAALAKARAAEAEAFKAAYAAGAKPDAGQVIAGIVDAAMATARLEAHPEQFGLRHELERLTADDDYSAKGIATLHLKHLQSGSSEPCPCHSCAGARAEAKRQQEEAARRAGLPTRMVDCPTHGRKRMPVEAARNLFWTDLEARVQELGREFPQELRGRWIDDLERAYCPKDGKTLLLVGDWLNAREKAKKKLTRVRRGLPSEGDTVTFDCPNCGAVATSEVYEDDTSEGLRVGCEACEFEALVAAVAVHRPAKAA